VQYGVKYVSLHEASGYGDAARSYLLGLMHTRIPVTWTPMVGGRRWGPFYRPFTGRSVGDQQLDPVCNKPLAYDTVILHLVPEYFPFWKEREPGRRLIGYTVWETDKLPDHWPPLLNILDHLLVPSQWNKSVFTRCGVSVPIDVIPHLISSPPLQRDELPWAIPPGNYVFYTIGTWTARKAIWNTVRCYLDTFSASDPVTLLIKTSRRDFTKRGFRAFFSNTAATLKRIVRTYPNPAQILLINREIDAKEISSIHCRGDCYISLCRSEGWGLGAFDAAASGKPVIMTGFGGQLDYLHPECAYRVDCTLVPVEDIAGWPSYRQDQRWAEPSLTHASFLMRDVFENREVAKERGERLASYILATFDNKKTIERLIEVLNAG
jgi:glycosyltransferase involved in cell wall biosynthesis